MGAFPLPEYVDIFLLGASAGGVEALSILLPALRRAGRSSGFVAMHRLRDKGSMLLPSILGRSCAAALVEAEDKLPIQNGTVYLAPADYHLLVDPGPAIALSADEPVHYSRPSIDVMFESAAHIYRERVLAVILTGANADGAAGLQAVRKAGGRHRRAGPGHRVLCRDACGSRGRRTGRRDPGTRRDTRAAGNAALKAPSTARAGFRPPMRPEVRALRYTRVPEKPTAVAAAPWP